MRRITLLVLVALPLVAVLATLQPALSVPASAGAAVCRYPPVSPKERVEAIAEDEWPELVLVGIVTQEIRVEPVRNSVGSVSGWVPSKDQSPGDGTFQSTVRPDAILAGGRPAGDIEIPALRDGADCIGGPRLREGEHVLLFLKSESGPPGSDDYWLLSPFGGKVILKDGSAYLHDLMTPDEPQLVGTADDLIRRVATTLGSTPEDRDAALVAAGRAQPGGGWSAALTMALLVSAAVALGLSGALLRSRLRRS